ncbi:MAG: class I SAM-dependent methyltransferase [Janthinobacterium lividum]
MSDRPIINWSSWTDSPAGRYILQWEQAQLDLMASDIFGYNAVQLGLPQLDGLRENRMPSRAIALDAGSPASQPFELPSAVSGRTTLWCDFLELPFETQSIDLLVLPHTLEFARDPHTLLREAARVLVPEGRLIIIGFNSLSLWGMRHSIGRMSRRPFAPAPNHLIAFLRMKDWIKLIGFELNRGRFGCYRPPLATDKWLNRWAFLEPAGDRWWPIFGAIYIVTAIKRVHGMRLVGPIRAKKLASSPALAPIATPLQPHGQQNQQQIRTALLAGHIDTSRSLQSNAADPFFDSIAP